MVISYNFLHSATHSDHTDHNGDDNDNDNEAAAPVKRKRVAVEPMKDVPILNLWDTKYRKDVNAIVSVMISLDLRISLDNIILQCIYYPYVSSFRDILCCVVCSFRGASVIAAGRVRVGYVTTSTSTPNHIIGNILFLQIYYFF
jgi:hypothetical protein